MMGVIVSVNAGLPGDVAWQGRTVRTAVWKNRVVVAPMHQYAAHEGFATDWHLVNAGRFAMGGCGMVMMESTKVERRGCGTVGDLGLWRDEFVPGLARCVQFIKARNAVPAIQIGHSGRKARLTRPWEGQQPQTPDHPEMWDWDGWELVAPSAIAHSDKLPTPRAFTRDEIPTVVQHWGEAAARAHRAGFEVLEIHAAHGYLIHQFLSPVANRRNDGYGGSDANRMRFALRGQRVCIQPRAIEEPPHVRACSGKRWPSVGGSAAHSAAARMDEAPSLSWPYRTAARWRNALRFSALAVASSSTLRTPDDCSGATVPDCPWHACGGVSSCSRASPGPRCPSFEDRPGTERRDRRRARRTFLDDHQRADAHHHSDRPARAGCGARSRAPCRAVGCS